jgi:hypothetical protein
MANTVKRESDRVGRKNISIRAVEVRLGKKIMAARNRGDNFSRLVCDLIHEAADRELGEASPRLASGMTGLSGDTDAR